jgi:hypothetical protein
MATMTFDTKTVIETLLGKDVSPETVDLIMKRLKTIVLPWRPDGCVPPKYVRTTGNGDVIATVDSWLGGYGSPHAPREHGWGFQVSMSYLTGCGACDSGIVPVEFGKTDSEKTIKGAERGAMLLAMEKVDAFLKREARHLVLLDEPLKEPK